MNEYIEALKEEWAKIEEADTEAKNNSTLVGRYITEPFADGQALYIITAENKTTVRIKCRTDYGDGWVIPYWGEETDIKRSYAEESIAHRERINKIFSAEEP